MKKLIFVFAFISIALTACCQTDQTFKVPVMFEKGFYFGDSTYMNTAAIGSGGAVYWESILNKPLTFPPASHTHDLLYKPIGYVPTWTEITGKPSTFPPSIHTTAWTDITSKPTEIQLIEELPKMAYLPIPSKTTAQINATIVPKGIGAIVRDTTIKPAVYKLWDESTKTWNKVIITNQ